MMLRADETVWSVFGSRGTSYSPETNRIPRRKTLGNDRAS